MLPPIPPAMLAIMDRGVSVNVASRDARLRPSAMRALGSLIEQEGRRITVYIARRQGAQLLQDVATTGHIAVMFSEPSSHRTLQVKATKASLRQATAEDEPVLARYLASMEHEIELVGYPRALTRAMLSHRIEDVVAITFEPEQVFEQTPGPKAGQRMAGGA